VPRLWVSTSPALTEDIRTRLTRHTAVVGLDYFVETDRDDWNTQRT
jgi:hypothetical protein